MKNLLTAALGAVLGMALLSTPWGLDAQSTIRNVTISSIAAGDNNIGNVDIVTMPADATELPAAAALGDNTANPTVPGVGAFLMCWDGATWDRCTSGSSADTELPNAAALADNTANPTVPGVAAFLMCFDSATWDRCLVASDMTIGSAFGTSGPGIVASYKDFDGSALPTTANVNTEEEAVPLAASLQGVQYVMPVNEDGSLSPLVTEDVGETAANTLMGVGSVRRDTPASSAGTTGDNATFNTSELGALWVAQIDPCSSTAKITDPISLTTDTVIIAAVSAKKNYICELVVVASAAEIVSVTEGTGSVCGTSEAALMGSTTDANGLSFAANGGAHIGSGNSTALVGKTANVDTCLNVSGSNRVSGYVTYVQR